MKAAILTIGTEITKGYVVNSNASYLSTRLSNISVETAYQIAVPDDFIQIAKECKRLLNLCDILTITGGLGPTTDDITRNAIAHAFDIEFTISDAHLRLFENRLKRNNIQMPVNNEQQFLYPSNGGMPINNDVGVALGFMITKLMEN